MADGRKEKRKLTLESTVSLLVTLNGRELLDDHRLPGIQR